jgi:hypothetical protein
MKARFVFSGLVALAAAACVQSVLADETMQSGVRNLTSQEMTLESSKLADLNVYNSQHEKLGTVDNLIINAHTGQVTYGILDTGLMGKNIPVPWNALRLQTDQKNRFSFLLNIGKDRLANAPTYEKHNTGVFSDQQFTGTVDRFFGVRTAARPMSGTGEKDSSR